MSRSLHDLLEHIIDEADYLIEETSKLTKDEFLENRTLKRSFVRSLEVIGETENRFPKGFVTSIRALNGETLPG